MIETSALTTSPDETKAIDTINAIMDYVRAQRVNVSRYPKLLPLIQSFEGWYGALEVSHAGVFGHTITAEDVGEAQRRRAAINAAMGQKIPDTWTPSDAPQTPPDAPATDNTGYYVAGAALVLAALWLLKR